MSFIPFCKFFSTVIMVVKILTLFDSMLLSCHVRVSEGITLYSCLNVKELFIRSRHEIWSLSDATGFELTTTYSLAKWLIVRLRTKWLWARVQLQSLSLFWEYHSCETFIIAVRVLRISWLWEFYHGFENSQW